MVFAFRPAGMLLYETLVSRLVNVLNGVGGVAYGRSSLQLIVLPLLKQWSVYLHFPIT